MTAFSDDFSDDGVNFLLECSSHTTKAMGNFNEVEDLMSSKMQMTTVPLMVVVILNNKYCVLI
ncbi:hypothetical protein ACTXT7_013355 [Hymenolepis weldensis]